MDHPQDPANDDPSLTPGLAREFVDFLKHNKKWWLIPILSASLLLVVAAWLLPSQVAPFIYSLF